MCFRSSQAKPSRFGSAVSGLAESNDYTAGDRAPETPGIILNSIITFSLSIVCYT